MLCIVNKFAAVAVYYHRHRSHASSFSIFKDQPKTFFLIMPSDDFLRPPTTVNVDLGGGLESPLASFELTHEAEANAPLTPGSLALDRGRDKENNRLRDRDRTSEDIEGVIRNFNEELENLSQSIDQLTVSQSQSRAARRDMVEATTPKQRTGSGSAYINYSTSRKVGSTTANYNDKRPASAAGFSSSNDPPPSSASRMTPLRFSNDSTPQRGSTARKSRGLENNFDTSGRSYRSPFVNEPPQPVETPIMPPRRINERTNRMDSGAAPNDWEVTLDRMQAKLEDRDQKIRDLERENRELKRMIMEQDKEIVATNGRQPPSPFVDYNQSSRYDDPSSRRQQRSYYNNESANRTFRSTQLSTPPRDEEDVVPSRRFDMIPEDNDGFTPGTKFVAELARLMKIENGHQAPLSVVLDKHWHKLKRHMRDDTY